MMVALTTAILGLPAVVATTAQAQTPGAEYPPEYQGHGSESHNMRLVSHHDLDGRSAYQPLTKHNPVNDQWYTYVGHHAGSAVNSLTGEMEDNGTSIVRVTNPRRPRLVAHIPPTDPARDQSKRRWSASATAKSYRAATPTRSTCCGPTASCSHEIWDVTRAAPRRRWSARRQRSADTHKSCWDCESGLGYLVGGVPAGAPTG